jgi:hypothetical protein
MDQWEGLRIAGAVAAWATVAGGVLLTVIWLARGGGRAFGPNDELMVQSGVTLETDRPRTAFSSAQIGLHGFFGIMTAILLTYAVARSDDRVSGYIAVLVIAAITIFLGLLMFRKWSSPRRPAIDGDPRGDSGVKVEDGLPKIVVYGHGAAALGLVTLVVALALVDEEHREVSSTRDRAAGGG